MDFTLTKYTLLLQALKGAGYSFQTFENYIENPIPKVIILRHDVDKLPYNSLATARIENEFAIKGSYYFRIGRESNNPEVINLIAEMGHEIGYHYETMDTCHGDVDKAFETFCKNLEYFKTLYPVKTICMHGSPLSKYDNKDIWKIYDYKNLGLIGEPYFDIDFSKVYYLTDTGRRWDGDRVSVRDKVNKINDTKTSKENRISLNVSYRHTENIIKAIETGYFSNQIMITIHPQRWNDSLIQWTKELILQNIKNILKRGLIKVRT